MQNNSFVILGGMGPDGLGKVRDGWISGYFPPDLSTQETVSSAMLKVDDGTIKMEFIKSVNKSSDQVRNFDNLLN